MEDTWKNIKRYEGLYMVSDSGKVRNVRSGRILKQGISKRGYSVVVLYKQGKPHTVTCHRLVASAFIPNPHNYGDVNHIDSNRINNHVSNLEWVNRSMNLKHGFKHGDINPPDTSKPIIQCDLDGIELQEFESVKEAALKTNSDSSHISKVLNGRLTKTNGFKWKHKEKQLS